MSAIFFNLILKSVALKIFLKNIVYHPIIKEDSRLLCQNHKAGILRQISILCFHVVYSIFNTVIKIARQMQNNGQNMVLLTPWTIVIMVYFTFECLHIEWNENRNLSHEQNFGDQRDFYFFV